MFKRLLTSKTFWMGIVSVGYGIYQIISGDAEMGRVEIGIGLTAIFMRDAIAKGPDE